MLKLKRILSAVLVVAMTIVMFAGCSKASSTKTSSEQKPVTLVYSYGGSVLSNAVNVMLKNFMDANPNIKVTMQQLPASATDQHAAYVTSLSSGDDSFDVFGVDNEYIGEFAGSGWLLNLTDKFTKTMQKDYLQSNIYTVNNKIYTVPWFTDAPFLYYRTDIIKTPPKTWQDLITMAKANAGKAKYGFVCQAAQYEGLVCDAEEYIWGNGGDIIKDGKPVINSPQAIVGLQQFVDVINSGITPPGITTYLEEDSRNVFQQGNSIFMRNWAYCMADAQSDGSAVKGKVAIAPLPIGPSGDLGYGTLGGWNIAINYKTKHPAESWKLIQFMTNYDSQVLMNVLGGFLPTREAVYSDAVVDKTNPWVPAMLTAVKQTKQRPASPYYSQMSDSMQVNFQKAILKKITATEACNNIQKDLTSILAKGK
jgi:multiple sugar transport system substrate-binding protein